MTTLLIALIGLGGCLLVAVIAYCAIGHLCEHAEDWSRTTFDDVYGHPYSKTRPRGGEAPGARPGPNSPGADR